MEEFKVHTYEEIEEIHKKPDMFVEAMFNMILHNYRTTVNVNGERFSVAQMIRFIRRVADRMEKKFLET